MQSALSDYERDPARIYEKSFQIVEEETDLEQFSEDEKTIAIRIIHACGIPEIAPHLRFSADAHAAARKALARQQPVFCDCQMVRSGIIRAKPNSVYCSTGNPAVEKLAQKLGTTRSAAAVELWKSRLEGAIVVIGNAPTALFHLVDLVENGGPRPSLIIAFPVGFVGAAESKERLISSDTDIPYLTLLGRMGGSAMAAAAFNALTIGLNGDGRCGFRK